MKKSKSPAAASLKKYILNIISLILNYYFRRAIPAFQISVSPAVRYNSSPPAGGCGFLLPSGLVNKSISHFAKYPCIVA
ncbi:hypothetical protein [Pedobacter ureilyticus]|uniref:hypothetical protein n=1 Tax=Pedobacter ureilyticus TaxID=1393051 RepID=UPI001B8D44C4|nr:hypothetical protein [Pedobacter helvus]